MQRRPPDVTLLERLTVVQVAVYLVGSAWAFGGNADFVQPYLLLFGVAGAAITAAALLLPGEREFRRRALTRLWPLLLLNALTLVALLTPGFRAIRAGGELMLLPRYVPVWRPSSATPHLARSALALFDGVYCSAFNLFVLVRRRRSLRTLLLILSANAVALAIFGTLQKLSHASGLYFGRVRSPQDFFFATFIYDNHWGSFIILSAAGTLALLRHHAHRPAGRGPLHSPVFGAAVALLVLAMSVPLSGARVCSVLLLAVIAVDLIGWAAEVARAPSGAKARRLTLAAAALAVGGLAVWWVGRETIAARIAKTREQVVEIRTEQETNQRVRLYRDTWRMGQARPWFGWGAGSFPHVFQLYNTARPNRIDHLPKFFHDAHSDWLQSLAEHGKAGAAALVLCAAVPLATAGRRAWNNRLSRRLLMGCAAVLFYAAVEFPFGNFTVLLTWWVLFFTALRYGVLSSAASASRPSPPALS